MAQINKNTVSAFRVDDLTWIQIVNRAKDGKAVTEVMREILADYFRRFEPPELNFEGPTPAAPLEESDDLRQRRLAAQVEEAERKNREAAGELIRADAVKLAYDKHTAPMRQAIQQVVNSVDGLTEEQRAQLTKWSEDTLTNFSGGVFG